VRIGNREISSGHKPFIVAEMSGNHNNSLDRALEILTQASKAGVDAVKLQTYTADTITLDAHKEDFIINDENSLWNGMRMYDLYRKASTPWDWHEEIFNKAKELGILCFSSPFDETAVDFLEDINTPAYKIASFENTHLPLIKKIISTGKPVIMSTGMASISELSESVSVLTEKYLDNFALLKCTSTYPAKASESNIITIPHMKKLFNCQVGLSDHTIGIGTSIAAVAHGASIIEKHFTLDKEDKGVDSAFSINPKEMNQLVNESRQAWESLGVIKYGPTKSEKESVKRRRSIYVSVDILENQILSEKNIKVVRPGYGLPPKHYDSLLGMRANKNLYKGTPIDWGMVKQ